MYKGLYTFLNNNNIIYNLQFGFRQHCSTSHALINITENITKALDDGSIGCRVFVDLQKAVDTGDHQILLAKLDHYGICGVSNDSFKSYLLNCNQYVSKNGWLWSCCYTLWCPSKFCSRAPSVFAIYKWPLSSHKVL